MVSRQTTLLNKSLYILLYCLSIGLSLLSSLLSSILSVSLPIDAYSQMTNAFSSDQAAAIPSGEWLWLGTLGGAVIGHEAEHSGACTDSSQSGLHQEPIGIGFFSFYRHYSRLGEERR